LPLCQLCKKDRNYKKQTEKREKYMLFPLSSCKKMLAFSLVFAYTLITGWGNVGAFCIKVALFPIKIPKREGRGRLLWHG
jgi:hypothetical protein